MGILSKLFGKKETISEEHGKYLDQVTKILAAYSKCMEDTKKSVSFEQALNKRAKRENYPRLQTTERLPYKKEQIADAILYMISKIKKKQIPQELIEMFLGPDPKKAMDNTIFSYCYLIMYQPKDVVKKFNFLKSKHFEFLNDLAKPLRKQYKKEVGEELPDRIMNQPLAYLKVSKLLK